MPRWRSGGGGGGPRGGPARAPGGGGGGRAPGGAGVASWGGPEGTHQGLVAAERLPMVQAVLGPLSLDPPITAPPGVRIFTEDEAATTIVQGWLEAVGPTTARALSSRIGVSASTVEIALAALEGRGAVLRGRFTKEAPPDETEWCGRRVLPRRPRPTAGRARAG